MSNTILVITSSINGHKSFSTQLAEGILRKLTLQHPESRVIRRDLVKQPFPQTDASYLQALGTPESERTPVQQAIVSRSDEAVAELFAANQIVIGVPMYNFGISEHLKSWLSHISRAGLTFTYEDGMPKGLVVNRKVYLAIATGGIYTIAGMREKDFTEPYLRTVLGFLGMTDISVFRSEGTAIPGIRENALPAALEAVDAFHF